VNGLRAIYKKNFLEWFIDKNADIFCIQETKAHREQLADDLIEREGYSSYFAQAEKKGKSYMVEYRVVKPRKSSIKDPIKLQKNERVECGEEYNENKNWSGWIWCKIQNNAGWVPKQIIEKYGNKGILLEDYNGTEFDIEVNEILIMERKLNGWIWGFKKETPNIKGWAPLDYLEKI